jgi:hypothetical protein
MTPPKIVITDWDRLQHFKDREPIWIKLYRALRQSRHWRLLSGDAAKLYIDLMLLASEEKPFGSIQLHLDELCWEVRLDPDALIPLLEELGSAHLISSPGYRPDIKLISAGNQEDDVTLSLARSREVEAEEEVEVEKETTSVRDLKRFLYLDTEELALFCRDFGISTDEKDATLERLRV